MFTETLNTQHPLGLVKLTGSNRGLYYANERITQLPNPENEEETVPQYTYDVYEVPDARFPDAVKDAVILQKQPNDAEHKILRKTLGKVLKELNLYDTEDYAESRAYNEFVESI